MMLKPSCCVHCTESNSLSAGPRLGLKVLSWGMEEYLDQSGTQSEVLHGMGNVISDFYSLKLFTRVFSNIQPVV